MTAERACERCAARLEGRRPDARFCSAACRRAAARTREAGRGRPAGDRTENPHEETARRAHASYAALRRLEERLDVLAHGLHSADARLLARVTRDALREEKSG